jgi:hypothetical protein
MSHKKPGWEIPTDDSEAFVQAMENRQEVVMLAVAHVQSLEQAWSHEIRNSGLP